MFLCVAAVFSEFVGINTCYCIVLSVPAVEVPHVLLQRWQTQLTSTHQYQHRWGTSSEQKASSRVCTKDSVWTGLKDQLPSELASRRLSTSSDSCADWRCFNRRNLPASVRLCVAVIESAVCDVFSLKQLYTFCDVVLANRMNVQCTSNCQALVHWLLTGWQPVFQTNCFYTSVDRVQKPMFLRAPPSRFLKVLGFWGRLLWGFLNERCSMLSDKCCMEKL